MMWAGICFPIVICNPSNWLGAFRGDDLTCLISNASRKDRAIGNRYLTFWIQTCSNTTALTTTLIGKTLYIKRFTAILGE